MQYDHVDIQVVMNAAKAGGKVLMQYFGQVLDTEEKSTAADFRTKADIESEQATLAILQKAYPAINIYAEESGQQQHGSDLTFVIDPLDGSNNFALGTPVFTVSIALMQGNETVLAVIYDPVLNHTYWAIKGKGAFRDRTPLSVSQESNITRATIAYANGYTITPTDMAHAVNELNRRGVKRIVNNWSPAHDGCIVGAGRIDGFINNKTEIYDYVGCKLIVREAGGKITDFSGEPVDDLESACIMSNGTALHDVLVAAVS